MLGVHPSNHIPVELISMVLDYADLAQLVRLSHICVRWRAVARAHPLFWRDIRLSAASTTALDFFQARIDQRSDRSINIDIFLSDSTEFERIRSVVMPAIARCLAQITRLGLFLHHDTSPYVLPALKNSAPRLEALALLFYHVPTGHPAALLSADMLASSCPKLDTLLVGGVSFPTSPIGAFATVRRLAVHSQNALTFHIDMLAHLPAVTGLSLTALSCAGVDPGENSANILRALSLDTLDVQFRLPNYAEIFSCMPQLESIPLIVCRRPVMETVQLLLGHIPGPMSVEYACKDSGIYVTFYSSTSGHARTFVQWESSILRDWPQKTILSSDQLGRITALKLPERLTFLVPHLGEMPACTILQVVLASESTLALSDALDATAQATWLPALTTVAITLSEHCAHRVVSAQVLHAFLTQLLGSRAKRVRLGLDGIHLSGDIQALARDFDSV